MKITLSQLDIWLTVPSEDEHLEFKEAKDNFHFEKLVEYCVALTNEGGGHIVFGVTNKPPRKVVGTNVFKTLPRTVGGIYERLRIKVTGTELNHPEGRVLVFSVPPRPEGYPIHYKGKFLMRAGEALVPMSQDQLREIFNEGQPDVLKDIVSDQLGLSDIDELLDTRSYFNLLQQPYPRSPDRVLERFMNEGLVVETGRDFAITYLGAILFARTLTDFEKIAHKAPRVIVYEGKSKLSTLSDKPGTKGYAVGFSGLVGYINDMLPSNEVIEQALRKTVKVYPDIAIRELVANALIHQDFSETGATVTVEIYLDRIEFTNPGLPNIPIDRFIDENKTRNEVLANLLRRLGICEEKGSGIDKVISSVELYQLPAPDFRVGEKKTSVLLFAPKEIGNMNKRDRIRACYQHCCLKYVMNDTVNNSSLRARFGLKDGNADLASRILRDTLKQELIKLDDPDNISRKYAQYIPYWA